MNIRNRSRLILPAILALAACGHTAAAPKAQALKQQIAIPSYFYPGALWTQMEAAAPTVHIAVINPGSGPGTAPDAKYQAQVQQAQAKGIAVLGYVHTSYGKRPIAEVRREIGLFAQWYHVDGILVDETASDAAHVPYYIQVNAAVKAARHGALTVLNPGNETNEGYLKAGDILITFEGTYNTYTHDYTVPAWVGKYPARRFWHLIHSVPDTASMLDAVRLSKQRHAGYVYVTSDTMENPWDTLPPNDYWTKELAAVAAR